MSTSNVAQAVREFIVSNFLYQEARFLKDDDSFMEEDIVDSTGVLQLVAFLEETFSITVKDEELIPENLDSISRVSAYLVRKMSAAAKPNMREQQGGTLGGKV